MFNSRYFRQLKLLVPILIGVLLLSGCIGRFQPQGWSGPVVEDGILYIGSQKGKLLALDTSNRNTIWEFAPEARQASTFNLGCSPSAPALVTYGTPAVSGDMVYIGSYDGKLYALDAKSGMRRWEYTTDGPIIGSPVIAGTD